jgi:DNA-directed RNA polymerase subunit RPC12/RpoP
MPQPTATPPPEPATGPACTRCGSKHTTHVGTVSRGVSGTKVALGVMTAGLSLGATGVKSKKEKADWICLSCKKRFRV